MIAVLECAQHALVRATDSTPIPSPRPEFVEDTVTPGLFGFIAILLVAVVTVLLALDMVRRIRRTIYTAQVRERLDAEEAERASGR
ncbi:hypothetical protein E2R33_03290 [Rathayibacter toxicus]|uniref:hypothetical protein n=1 Tax=Rathayibacter toxicus TaxID=145458 RepID=UPI001C05ADD1|nr:hypothetical protein [Rathayibacter toxicus]QWL27742.1 hypothetical protein E2R33_03290 [Rathayibacter toxicus]